MSDAEAKDRDFCATHAASRSFLPALSALTPDKSVHFITLLKFHTSPWLLVGPCVLPWHQRARSQTFLCLDKIAVRSDIVVSSINTLVLLQAFQQVTDRDARPSASHHPHFVDQHAITEALIRNPTCQNRTSTAVAPGRHEYLHLFGWHKR